jgi:hypothetical protein
LLAVTIGGAVAPLIAGRARAQGVPGANRPARDLAGCYRLTLGSWSMNSDLGPRSPTEIFRLDTTSVTREIPVARAAARVAPVDLPRPTDPRSKGLRQPSWRMIGADSLEITTWSTATQSEAFYGHVVGAELRGVLRNTNDVIPIDPKTRRIRWDGWPWPWARAVARRVACP